MSSPCCDHHESHLAAPPEPPAAPGKRLWPGVMRFLSWFIGFSGLYAMGAVCPFCGRQGCPTGAASAGLIGLVFASLVQWGRTFRLKIADFFGGLRN